jgi:hypothetical protein
MLKDQETVHQGSFITEGFDGVGDKGSGYDNACYTHTQEAFLNMSQRYASTSNMPGSLEYQLQDERNSAL